MNNRSHSFNVSLGIFVTCVLTALTIAAENNARHSTARSTEEAVPSSSLMIRSVEATSPVSVDAEPHALLDNSMFAIAPVNPRSFKVHDLVQIIVRETTTASSKHELETEKDYALKGGVNAWPDLSLKDLLNLQIAAGRATGLPNVDLDMNKQFEGQGDYKRQDDFTARLTAEVIEVLPNGNLILEARTNIKMDEEESTIKVTGICRPSDVSAANVVLSSQIHDLTVEKINRGELKKSNEKGIIAKVLDTIFAF